MKTTMNILLISLSWLLIACGKTDSLPPYQPPVNPIDTVSQYGTPFTGVVDRQDAVIYQVNMRVFSQQGNFAGVIARLDSIKALGANVIYLMPIYPVGIVNAINSPYAIRDYTSVNSEFGTLNDLRSLVDAAHSKGMSVILDWVSNHTAWDHPWITAHKDWYMQNANGNVISPPGTGWNDVAQLNFNSMPMRKEMIKSMKYWVLKANIDGFRFDYADGPPIDFWKQAIDTLRSITTHKLLLLAEGARPANYGAGFDFNFGFGFFDKLKSVFGGGQSGQLIEQMNTTDYSGSANGQQIVRYTSNHDVNGAEGTPMELFGGTRGAMAAFTVVSLMKSVPMIYGGQEVATPIRLTFPFTSNKIDWNINPEIKSEYKKIISFRNNSLAVRRGSLQSYGNADVISFTKESGAEKVLVIVNLRNAVTNYSIPQALVGTSWTNALDNSNSTLSANISLQPFEYFLYKN